MNALPLVIEFSIGSKLTCETEHSSDLAIIANGPPGTSVVFPTGQIIPLPTDQIVNVQQDQGAVVVGFGGMKFDCRHKDLLVFRRYKDLESVEQLSPERGLTMTLAVCFVENISFYGNIIWQANPAIH